MKYIIFFITIIFLNKSFSQDSTWAIYDTTNSILPTNYINKILIDSMDTKWIGTVKGLVKINIDSWKVYNSNNTPLLHNNITDIAYDHNGNIWVGTINGLGYFDMKSWTIYTKENSDLLENRIFSIAVDSTNRVWVGSSNGQTMVGGLSIFDGIIWTNYTYDNSELPDSRILSIKIENENLAWLGTVNGLVKFCNGEMEIFKNSNSNLPTNYISSIDIDKDGNTWIAARADAILDGNVYPGGLIKMKGTTMTVFDSEILDSVRSNSINTLAVDNNGYIWFGIEQVNDINTYFGRALGVKKNEHWNYFFNYYSSINSIAFNKNNEIWIGTDRGVITTEIITNLSIKSENKSYLPNKIFLYQNYPNPFNPTTTIEYSLPSISIRGDSKVSLVIYDLLGRKIKTLVDKEQPGGIYKVTFNGIGLSSGIYFYCLNVGNRKEIKKLVLSK